MALILMPFALAPGCAEMVPSASSDIMPSSAITNIPGDFYIIYEIMYLPFNNDYTFSPDYFRTALDTRSNIWGDRTFDYAGSYQIADWTLLPYHMPHKDLQDIYNAILEYNIESYNSSDVLTNDSLPSFLHDYYRITFCLNREIYSVTFGGIEFGYQEEYASLVAFHNMLSKIWVRGRPNPT